MATAQETFQLWSLPEPYPHLVEFGKLPPREICRDCSNQTQYICLEDGNIPPLRFWTHGITLIFSTLIVLLAPPFHFDFSMWKTGTPGSSITGKLHKGQTSQLCLRGAPSSTSQKPFTECQWESILTQKPPRSYLSSKIWPAEITAGSDVWYVGQKEFFG